MQAERSVLQLQQRRAQCVVPPAAATIRYASNGPALLVRRSWAAPSSRHPGSALAAPSPRRPLQQRGRASVQCQSAMHLGQPDKPRWGAGFSKEEVAGYMRMARLHNTLPALLLVLVGAWSGMGRSPAVLSNMTVWLMALISAGVSAASMVINDYFDWVSGNDQVNAPHKPLPSGQVKPDMAVLIGGGIYVLVLMAACVMPHPGIRGIVAFSAGATLLYTPVFKRVTMVKNALVASVIALAPLSGALAAGAGVAMLQRLAVPSLFAFTAIMFREVLMDCADEQGDREAGVVTLPVLVGPAGALLLATVLLLGGALAAISGLLTSAIPLASAAAAGPATTAATGAAAASAAAGAGGAATTAVQVAGAAVAQHVMPLSVAWPHLACAVLVGLSVLQLVAQVVAVYTSGMSAEAISSAVDDCVKPIGLAIIMLAAMA